MQGLFSYVTAKGIQGLYSRSIHEDAAMRPLSEVASSPAVSTGWSMPGEISLVEANL